MNCEALGKKIRERRRKLGLTQEALAFRAGIARATLSKIEAGRAPLVAFGTICRLLDLLGLEFEIHEKEKRPQKKLWTPEELLS